MKFVKMSLAAAVMLGASAFAIDNVKVSGDAKLYYGTHDVGGDLFNKGNSFADTAVRVGVTADLIKGVSAGVTGYAVSTLGLENNLVSNTWTGAHGAAGNKSAFGAQVNDASWIGEAWLAGTIDKTTAKVGRMELDTPLAFSEKWSVVPNTFEGAVLINQNIPDTTLVGAWVGKGNGTNALNAAYTGAVGIDGIVAADAKFNTYMTDGAYAAAIVNNSLKPLVAQAWYYGVRNVADAYWLQADWDCQLVKGAKVGVQAAELSPTGLLAGAPDSQAWAAKLAYTADALTVSAAYSEADKDGVLKVANTATNNLGYAQSKLYTEAYWNYGYVGAAGAKSVNVTANYDAGVAKLGAFYTNVTDAVAQPDMQEVAIKAAKSFGPLDATLAYVNTDVKGADAANMILAMFKLNF